MIRGNGIDVLEHLIAPGSLTGVRVFFPDPWPKARHHKRRFLQPATVGLIADRLLPGGVLHAATDHPGYAEHIAEVGDGRIPAASRRSRQPSLPISVVRPTTKYETKAHEAGSAVTELIWKKTMTMSVTEETTAATPETAASPGGGFRRGAPGPSDSRRRSRRVLLVWDAPNLDMGLGSILGRRPTALERPRFDALGRWLLARTAEVSSAGGPASSVEPEATVFTNIAPGSADVVRPWVDALRNVGFAVFAKPKIDEDSDVDRDMLAHIEQRRTEGLAALVVASADGQAFRQPLEEIARASGELRFR